MRVGGVGALRARGHGGVAPPSTCSRGNSRGIFGLFVYLTVAVYLIIYFTATVYLVLC